MICRPKDQGGLGIIDTKKMNECLMVKWIRKIFQKPDELWFRIVKAKYLGKNGFFQSSGARGSQFWKGIHSVKHLFDWGAVFQIGNGLHCRFWEDCWLKTVPLKVYYEDLYKMAREPLFYVRDCWEDSA